MDDPVTDAATDNAQMTSTGHASPIICIMVLFIAVKVVQHFRPDWTVIITRIIYSQSVHG